MAVSMRVNLPGAHAGGRVADNPTLLASLADHARSLRPDADELMVYQGGQLVATVQLKG
jgi:hypothetical protein